MTRSLALACLAIAVLGPSSALRAGVTELLQEAMFARTADEAKAKLKEADRQAQALSALPRAFTDADILRTRGQVNVEQWRREPDNPAKAADRLKGQRQLLAARDAYKTLVGQCEDAVAKIEARVGDPSTNPAYREATGNVSRANYSMAWTLYNLGTSYKAGEPDRQTFLEEAAKAFEDFTSEGYKNHPIIADCFLGQALCLYELKKPFDVIKLLEPVTAANSPPDLFKQITYMRVKCFLDQPSPAQADAAASKYLGPILTTRKLDAIELGLAIEWAKALVQLADPKANPAGFRMAQSQLAFLKQQLYAYGKPWSAEMAKVVGEAPPPEAAEKFKKVVDLFNAKQYKEALAESENGIRENADKTAGPMLADLYFFRLASLWNLEQWRNAHLAAYEFIRLYPKDARASDVCRRALTAGLKALKAAPPLTQPEFDKFIAYAQANFPTEPEVLKYPWYKASQLLAAQQYREAEAALQAIPSASPAYRQAQYGLILAAYKQAEQAAKEAKPDLALTSGHLGHTVAGIQRFIATNRDPVPAEDRPLVDSVVNIALATGQKLLDQPKPDLVSTAAVLDHLDGWKLADGVAAESRQAMRLSISMAGKRTDELLQDIDEMLRKAKPQNFHAAQVLIRVADPLEKESEKAVKSGNRPAARRIDDRLQKVYDFLIASMRQSSDPAFRAQETTIHRRLGHLCVRLSRNDDAMRHYEMVIEKVPKEKAGDVLRGLALCYEQARRYDKTLDLWRVLAGGLAPETDDWFEAKLHLMSCYWESGQSEQARSLMKYFRLQHPKGAPGQWKAQFDALHDKMGLSDDKPATVPPRK